MKRKTLIAMALLLSALFTFGGGVALAHGGKGVTVQPLTPKPGEVITVTGDELGASSTVEVRLIGTGVDIDLGEAQANDEGDFTAQFRVPANLAPGNYQIQVVAAGTTESTTSPAMTETPAPPVRERPLGETIGLVTLFGVLAGLGLFFARMKRREPAAS